MCKLMHEDVGKHEQVCSELGSVSLQVSHSVEFLIQVSFRPAHSTHTAHQSVEAYCVISGFEHAFPLDATYLCKQSNSSDPLIYSDHWTTNLQVSAVRQGEDMTSGIFRVENLVHSCGFLSTRFWRSDLQGSLKCRDIQVNDLSCCPFVEQRSVLTAVVPCCQGLSRYIIL